MIGKDLRHQVSINRILVCVLLISVLTLFISFGMEIIGGIQPCRLCIWQRIPYALMFFVAIAGIFSQNKIISIWLISFIALISFFIASYHFAIQIGLFADPCIVNVPHDLADFKKRLFETPLPCSKISWSIFGIPFSAINSAVSVFCSLSTFYVATRKRKKELTLA